ncbi:MAG: arsenite efflux transporter metallochaperone ArsD [Vicinamibacterales bacterium]
MPAPRRGRVDNLEGFLMTAVRVFDPAMCCSSGVCGPSVDPALARFAADLDWLKAQGVSVERFNLAQQPGAFAEDQAARSVLETTGDAGLPLVKVNGDVKSSGVYPSREELAAWAGVGAPAPKRIAAIPIVVKAETGGCCTPKSSQAPGGSSSTKSGRCC